MKNKFHLRRRLALTVAALSLWSSNGFALTKAISAIHPPPAAGTVMPATKMTVPSVANAASAKTPSVMNEDIRDIRGPKHFPSPWLWTLWLTGGVGLAALLSAGWLWNRRRALAAVLLPYEIALARLEEARALMQPENAREFSIAVSEIVRHYIEVRFQVLAARSTTEEFLHDLLEPSDALLTSHREMLADFLHHCDLAKFARWILSIKEMDTMLQSAHAFVLETGRPPTPETNSAAAQSGPERAPVVAEPAHATS